MDPNARWGLVNLCYAGIGVVAGLLLVAIGAGAESDLMQTVGGFAAVIGVLYLLAGLFWLARSLMDRPTD